MKYLKTFENSEKKIYESNIYTQPGDWAIVVLDKDEYKYNKGTKLFYNFVTNTPGKVTEPSDINAVYLEYENIPKEIKTWFVFSNRAFKKYEIDFCSTNKEDVKVHLDAKNYNL